MPRHSPGDYVRAFVVSLKMTMRGEKPESLQAEADHAPLFGWFRQTVVLTTAAENAASTAALDLQTIILRLDSRDTSLKMVLDGVRFHAAQEYPMLIRQRSKYAILAVQATNLNDRYALVRFIESPQLSDALRQPLQALSHHLEQLPKT